MKEYEYVPKVDRKSFYDLRPNDIVRVVTVNGVQQITRVVSNETSMESRKREVRLDNGELLTREIADSFHKDFRTYKRVLKK